MSNPRIYMAIATFFPWVGGAEKQAFALAQNLRQRGYSVTIITFRHEKTWLLNEVIEGVPVIRIAGRLLVDRKHAPRFLQKLLYLMAMAVMGWVLWQHRRRYDILHVYQLNLLALPTALACRFTGKPMVIGVRSVGIGQQSGLHNKISLVAGPLDADLPWLQIDGTARCGGDLEDLERLGKCITRFTRSLLERIQAVVVILSTRMKVYLAEHDFHLSTTLLIPNGVDIARFHPAIADSSLAERDRVVICVSRLSHEKGIDVLLQAWYLVHKQLPQAKLIIVGNGPLQAQLERMAQALGITDSVEFAGLQSDIPAQFQRGNLAILPSNWEGMPNALLEAMACGLPCVATRVSGSEDIIQHGVNGLLVEPQDYQGMAQALLTLLNDTLLSQKYGRAARETVERRYSLEQVMDRYIELYQRISDQRCQKTGQSISNGHDESASMVSERSL